MARQLGQKLTDAELRGAMKEMDPSGTCDCSRVFSEHLELTGVYPTILNNPDISFAVDSMDDGAGDGLVNFLEFYEWWRGSKDKVIKLGDSKKGTGEEPSFVIKTSGFTREEKAN